jgi:head-tail adaptor
MSIGAARHRVLVETPQAPAPDGLGGYTEAWTAATPALWDCSITPATARDLERLTAGTSLAAATHILRGRYHPELTTASRLVFGVRVFLVVAVGNPDERAIDSVVIAAEVLTPARAAARAGPRPGPVRRPTETTTWR